MENFFHNGSFQFVINDKRCFSCRVLGAAIHACVRNINGLLLYKIEDLPSLSYNGIVNGKFIVDRVGEKIDHFFYPFCRL